MNGIIVYKGKYGATRQYADWIGEELSWPVTTPDTITTRQLLGSDYIVMGSSVYAGKLQLREWLQQNVLLLNNKKLFLFIVCATPASEKEILDTIIKNNLPAEIRHQCDVYFLRGRMIRNGLSWKDRLMLKMGAMLEKDPAKKQTMLQDFDDVKKEHVTALTAAVKKRCAGASAVRYIHKVTHDVGKEI